MPKFSIVVPVHNREKLISTCIHSICNSSFDDFELLIIDDGSTDASFAICSSYAEGDERIKLFTQPNKGVSCARNLGIENATGMFIIFIDSDDALPSDALSQLSTILEDGCDLIMCNYRRCSYEELDKLEKDSKQIHTNEIQGNREVTQWIFNVYNKTHDDYFFVWSKVFRLELIKASGVRFQEDVSLGEDQIFVVDFLRHANNLKFTNIKLINSLNWPFELRSTGLGSVMRSADNFLHNQQENYNALLRLHNHTRVSAVREYASCYIIDRPISRIIFRNCLFTNKNRESFIKLFHFTKTHIRTIIINECRNISLLKNNSTKIVAILIANNQCFFAVVFSYVYVNAKTITSHIKFSMRKFLDKISVK